MLLAGAVERRRAMSLNRNNNSSPETRSHETGNSTDSANNTSPRNSSSQDSTIEETGGSSVKAFEFASDEMIARVLASCPRARQIASYAGQRSFRTVVGQVIIHWKLLSFPDVSLCVETDTDLSVAQTWPESVIFIKTQLNVKG
ncbi:unnamed protein product [Hydatigera taeniaeformis]|uniref:F-box domain-containing protein n=1 Tax=Hydatigena taeniaeformis TaxID=6205 RepID=A0A0R3WUE8_HYDTA|nr:unnamed protein product [Hydatigera taeniaeformis]